MVDHAPSLIHLRPDCFCLSLSYALKPYATYLIPTLLNRNVEAVHAQSSQWFQGLLPVVFQWESQW